MLRWWWSLSTWCTLRRKFFVWHIYTYMSGTYSELCEISKRELFYENRWRLSVAHHICKTLHFRCLAGLWIRLCILLQFFSLERTNHGKHRKGETIVSYTFIWKKSLLFLSDIRAAILQVKKLSQQAIAITVFFIRNICEVILNLSQDLFEPLLNRASPIQGCKGKAQWCLVFPKHLKKS